MASSDDQQNPTPAGRRRNRAVKRLSLAVVLAVLAEPAGAQTLTGDVVIVDGDTLRIGNERIRLVGIDAPEIGQTCAAPAGEWACGQAAAAFLGQLIGDQPVGCSWSTRDRYDRALGVCETAGGIEINQALVEAGLAWAYLWPTYLDAEATARAVGLGVWQAPTQAPAEYRALRDQAIIANQPLPPDPACIIKGNVNSAGDRIFHEPGTPGYADTVIRVEQGERWFCSAEEAIAAGWRRPRG